MHARTAMTLLLMLTPAQAETLSLEGDHYRIKVETDAGKFRELTFTNTANGDLIRSDNLFDIKGTDDRLTLRRFQGHRIHQER